METFCHAPELTNSKYITNSWVVLNLGRTTDVNEGQYKSALVLYEDYARNLKYPTMTILWNGDKLKEGSFINVLDYLNVNLKEYPYMGELIKENRVKCVYTMSTKTPYGVSPQFKSLSKLNEIFGESNVFSVIDGHHKSKYASLLNDNILYTIDNFNKAMDPLTEKEVEKKTVEIVKEFVAPQIVGFPWVLNKSGQYDNSIGYLGLAMGTVLTLNPNAAICFGLGLVSTSEYQFYKHIMTGDLHIMY